MFPWFNIGFSEVIFTFVCKQLDSVDGGLASNRKKKLLSSFATVFLMNYLLLAHSTKNLVFWPVCCPFTACHNRCTGCVLKCADRVRFPYIPGLTVCTDPSTARHGLYTRGVLDVYWSVLNVYGFLTYQDWPCVLTRLLHVHGLYTRGVLDVYWSVLNVYGYLIFQDWPRILARLLLCTQEVYWVYTERVRFPYILGLTACTAPSTACTQEVYWVYTERVPNVYGCLIFQD